MLAKRKAYLVGHCASLSLDAGNQFGKWIQLLPDSQLAAARAKIQHLPLKTAHWKFLVALDAASVSGSK